MRGNDDYGHHWAGTPDNERVECIWCLATPAGKGAYEPCDRAIAPEHDKPPVDLDAMITEAIHRDTVSEGRVREIVGEELRIYDHGLRRYMRRYVVPDEPQPEPTKLVEMPELGGTRADEPARWFDHWEDGASREFRGMREDDEKFAREQW